MTTAMLNEECEEGARPKEKWHTCTHRQEKVWIERVELEFVDSLPMSNERSTVRMLRRPESEE